ncbi:ferritin-like domain-containing protein [Nocardioides anomalus]|uniref:ferritin-like domain-containing protein n=1 Tax=Nocardioides anomalus TaxID=2712223 RepID=UPI001E39262A|nr:ferritin-like domain-containing protein [Nocardioides anomalus]
MPIPSELEISVFGKAVMKDMINRSAENEADRRSFLRAAGATGLGVVGATATVGALGGAAEAAPKISDGAILNFALNLEYLEAEFYNLAVYGQGLPAKLTGGKGKKGGVVGGSAVPFKTPAIAAYAREIAGDELDHVKFLRTALGSAKVARPAIDLQGSFTAAATAAGLITAGQTFNPFLDEDSFLLAAFLFEDVGVTAYKGAAPLISNKTYLEAAAGILSVEAYHAGIVRSALYSKGLQAQVQKLSDARDSLDGKKDIDQGIGDATTANLVPTDKNGITYSRDPFQVHNIAYLTTKAKGRGGFFPKGTNGTFTRSKKTA